MSWGLLIIPAAILLIWLWGRRIDWDDDSDWMTKL